MSSAYYNNRFTAPWTVSGTTRVSRYQKRKTNLDLLEQETLLDHTQICTLTQTHNHAAFHHSVFLQAECPSCCQTNSDKALKATTQPNFTKFSVHIACGHRLILLWQHCSMLCISSFVDDVMFILLPKLHMLNHFQHS